MNKNCIYIQNVKKEEYGELRQIFFDSRKENFSWIEPESIQLNDFDSSTEGELIFSAKINNKIVGFISIWIEDKFIHNLFVSSKFKGCGIGKSLINHAANVVGLPLTLKCVKANESALGFYLSQGWTMIDEITKEEPYYLMMYIG